MLRLEDGEDITLDDKKNPFWFRAFHRHQCEAAKKARHAARMDEVKAKLLAKQGGEAKAA